MMSIYPDDSSTFKGAAGTEWRFYLLGDLRIEFRGNEIALPPYRTHSLLAALLLKPRLQPRHTLIGLLYPDFPESTGRRRLSDTLWLIRKALPALPLLTTVNEVGLLLDQRWLDIEQFLRHADQGIAQNAVEDCQAGLSLYRGDLLPGCLDEWLLAEREKYRLQFLRLLRHTAHWLSGQRQSETALPVLRRLLQEEPFDEDILRLLMRAYAALGQRGAALAVYERFTSLAADELGIEPDETTLALAQAIRSADPLAAQRQVVIPRAGLSEDTVSQAQAALAAGDFATAQAYLIHLRAQPPIGDALPVTLFEIDLALSQDDLSQAGKLLHTCPKNHPDVLLRQARLAYEQYDWDLSYKAASQALFLAHQDNNSRQILDALLAVADAENRLGRVSEARRSVEQALLLAERDRSPEARVRAQFIRGHISFRQGCHSESISFFRQAESLAREYGLRRYLALALRGIATNLLQIGMPLEALEINQQELSLWRDMHLRRREAQTLANLSIIYEQLGRIAEDLRTLELARQIDNEIGDEFGVNVCNYYLAEALLCHDESQAQRAVEIARQAVGYFHTHNHPDWEASTILAMGMAQWADGQPENAIQSFSQACAVFERLGQLVYLPSPLAFQALAYLNLGNTGRALEVNQQALFQLAQGAMDNDEAAWVYYAQGMILASLGKHDEAWGYFKRGYDILVKYAAHLEDETAREAFFHRNMITRRLMQEVYNRGIAPSPESGVVIRRVANQAGPAKVVQVTWTLDAGPADQALRQARGAVALRRARLSRLLREAQNQGARPTANQLADLLGVSARTLRRDMVTLHDLPGAS